MTDLRRGCGKVVLWAGINPSAFITVSANHRKPTEGTLLGLTILKNYRRASPISIDNRRLYDIGIGWIGGPESEVSS
jgi:hypothetical protein